MSRLIHKNLLGQRRSLLRTFAFFCSFLVELCVTWKDDSDEEGWSQPTLEEDREILSRDASILTEMLKSTTHDEKGDHPVPLIGVDLLFILHTRSDRCFSGQDWGLVIQLVRSICTSQQRIPLQPEAEAKGDTCCRSPQHLPIPRNLAEKSSGVREL